MVLRAGLPFLFVLGLVPAQPPQTVEIQDLEGESAVRVKVGGKERLLALMSYWPNSYLVEGGGTVLPVALGGATIPVRFVKGTKEEMVPGSEGVLGADALRKVCVSFDTLYSTAEFLPRPKIGLAGAKAYFAKLPAWGGPSRVLKVPLGRSMQGAPTIKALVGGKSRPFTLSLSTYNSTLGKTTATKTGRNEDGWNFLPRFAIPGLAPRWLSYGYYPQWSASQYGSHGMIALDHFLSRRVLVDLAGEAVYIEELSEPARVSMLLTAITRLSIVVSGEKAMIEPIPGLYPQESVGEMEGSRIKMIAGLNVAELIREIRAGTAGAKLAKLSAAMSKDYDVLLVDPDGTEREITIPHDEEPTDTQA